MIQSSLGKAINPGEQNVPANENSIFFDNEVFDLGSDNVPLSMKVYSDFTWGTSVGDFTVAYSEAKLTFTSTKKYIKGASVTTGNDAAVTGCTIENKDSKSVTVKIPVQATFGKVTLTIATHTPFDKDNAATINGIESTYIDDGVNHPVPTVTYKEFSDSDPVTLTEGVDYTVSYNVGSTSGTVTVTGIGDYYGSVSKSYTIRQLQLSDFHQLGDGSYEIATKQDLDNLAKFVNNGNDCYGATFRQTADITYTYDNECTWDDTNVATLSDNDNFTPIGTYAKPFCGTYDGGGHSISGIRIGRDNKNDASRSVGLFGYVLNGTVKNVVLRDANILATQDVGGIVGYLFGTGKITDCLLYHVRVAASGSNNNIIVGNNDGGTVSGTHFRDCCISKFSNQGGGQSEVSGFYNDRRDDLYAVTLDTGVTASKTGGESATIDDATYYTAGSTLTLGYTGEVPAGYDVVYNSSAVGTVNGNSLTMPASDVSVTTTFVMGWTHMQDLLTNASTNADNPTLITLTDDMVAGSNDSYLNIPAGHHAIIDLNGHKIDRNLTEGRQQGYVIKLDGQSNNHASLVIRDSSNPSTGMITGGFDGTSSGGSSAGGINVQNGDLTLMRGSICGNKCTFGGGGGVRVAGGTFTMSGGSITGNVVNTIKGAAANAGGAIYGYMGDIYLRGGSITDNTTYSSSYACGGIAHDNGSGTAQFHLSGIFTLSGNHKVSYDASTSDWTTVANSDYLHGNREYIILDGPIYPTLPIAIDLYSGYNTCLTTNWNTHMGTANLSSYFTLVPNSESDGKSLWRVNNELHIGIPEVLLWGADAEHDGSSAENAYIITTPEGLDYLATYVNGGNSTEDMFFKLGDNITYTHKAADEAGADTENNFTPIGNSSKAFSGTFDGNNKAISGIRIYEYNGQILGLFGRVDNGSTIMNVILNDAVITGKDIIGGLVGGCNGTVKNCLVLNSVVTAINCDNSNVGAIVGRPWGEYRDNYYHCCTRTINGDSATNNFGTINGDITYNNSNGGCAAFTITTDPAISVTPTAAVTYQDVGYYPKDKSITLHYTGGGDAFTMPAMDVIALVNGYDNSNVIASNQGSGKNVALAGRLLSKDGAWSTLCLPFSLSANQIASSVLKGATLMELDIEGTYDGHQTGFDATDGTLYLYFKSATSITAGTPYIIKWDSGDDIREPVFTGVTIDNSTEAIARKTVTSADGKVSFNGIYSRVPFEANDKSILFLSVSPVDGQMVSTLYYPSKAMSINVQRAYFQLHNGLTAGDLPVNDIKMYFGEEERPTLVTLPSGREAAGAWYSLDGRKLDGKPVTKGVFIHGGAKVAIK